MLWNLKFLFGFVVVMYDERWFNCIWFWVEVFVIIFVFCKLMLFGFRICFLIIFLGLNVSVVFFWIFFELLNYCDLVSLVDWLIR